jgi:serine/threonine protein kinase
MEAIPGYRLSQRLGHGGFGEVWEAVGADGSLVALKFLDCQNKPAQVVINEIRLLMSLRQLSHPQLIELYSVHASGNYIILSMERADGSLQELQRLYWEQVRTHLPPDQLCELLGQAAEALDFLAAQKMPGLQYGPMGIQHCDIKPSNLLLVGPSLKVADFGLCASRAANGSRKAALGTPPYSAPELYEGRLTERTDQFSLAVTYCELRTGRLPFHGPLRSRDLHRMPPLDLSRLPDKEKPILARALEPTWFKRWPSCREFIDALREVVDTNPFPFDSQPLLQCLSSLSGRSRAG